MRDPKPTMKTVTRDEAQAQFDQLLAQVAEGKTRTRIEENGKPVAGLVSADELEFLAQFGALRERFQPLLESWAAFEGEDPERIEQEAQRAVQAVRRKYPVSHSS